MRVFSARPNVQHQYRSNLRHLGERLRVLLAQLHLQRADAAEDRIQVRLHRDQHLGVVLKVAVDVLVPLGAKVVERVQRLVCLAEGRQAVQTRDDNGQTGS